MKTKLYNNNQSKNIDQLAAKDLSISSYELMQKAGHAIFQHIKNHPRVLVITGPGNNGGDGLIVAELARLNGQNVTLWALRSLEDLTGDARLAAKDCQVPTTFTQPNGHYDVIVDALFGSGLNKTITGKYADAIEWINQQPTTVISIDIPSGLNGDTGQVMEHAVKASQTLAILTHKPGHFTLSGKDQCGKITIETLHVEPYCFNSLPTAAELLNQSQLSQLITARQHNSHKGSFGHVWAAGGQAGMTGAVQLTAFAVLKSGAGAVTAVTDKQHSVTASLQHPEVMTHGYDETNGQLPQKPPDVLVIGMGLGQSDWSKHLFNQLMAFDTAKVVDADGLHFLKPEHLNSNDVITPHPLEAARLLNCSVSDIQADRLKACQKLSKAYNAVAILKGSGSVLAVGNETFVCPYGSDALATAGSGDVLAGMIAGLMAQSHTALKAAQLAVLWHAITGEKSRMRICLTATGILDELHLHLPA